MPGLPSNLPPAGPPPAPPPVVPPPAGCRRERALLNDLASVAQSLLMVFVVATVAEVPPAELVGVAAAVGAYLAGTVLYVKTMIREMAGTLLVLGRCLFRVEGPGTGVARITVANGLVGPCRGGRALARVEA
ncbi:hypothetical protein [Micromonospora sp. NPDC005305]|uniref:hypothetical protein n=1 Tax=Micromonospora sp. NPDC005305 TaxID=3156875 RepID=UPI0033AC0043